MFTIRGRVVNGLGFGQFTVKAQMPEFAKVFPEVKDCYQATMNIELEMPFRIQNPDYTTKPIKWTNNGPPERFSFLRVRFEIPLDQPHRDAWVYVPHLSPNNANIFRIEVLTEYVNGITYGTACAVHIAHDYREVQVIVV